MGNYIIAHLPFESWFVPFIKNPGLDVQDLSDLVLKVPLSVSPDDTTRALPYDRGELLVDEESFTLPLGFGFGYAGTFNPHFMEYATATSNVLTFSGAHQTHDGKIHVSQIAPSGGTIETGDFFWFEGPVDFKDTSRNIPLPKSTDSLKAETLKRILAVTSQEYGNLPLFFQVHANEGDVPFLFYSGTSPRIDGTPVPLSAHHSIAGVVQKAREITIVGKYDPHAKYPHHVLRMYHQTTGAGNVNYIQPNEIPQGASFPRPFAGNLSPDYLNLNPLSLTGVTLRVMYISNIVEHIGYAPHK
ncbi:hypothetical protein HZB01_03995 [Candidatus Woesearchaeota archaeon]|nr:hypothetical protein [Candidatus Woesearchaeota archaeon]